MGERIVVGMSGGVDSSVAAAIRSESAASAARSALPSPAAPVSRRSSHRQTSAPALPAAASQAPAPCQALFGARVATVAPDLTVSAPERT